MDFEFLTWLRNGGWVVPFIGIGVFGTAVFFGRRFLAGKPAGQETPEALFEVHFLGGVRRERRSAPRREGNTIEVRLSDGSDREPLAGWVLDRSIGGLGILVDVAVPIGSVFKVRAKNTGPTTQWVDITVRFTKPRGTQYELGCQFQRVPSWNELLQFG